MPLCEKEKDKTQKHREEGNVKMEVDTGAMYLQAKDCQGLPPITKS